MEKKVFVIFLFLVLAIFISFPHTCISQTNTFPSTGNVGIGCVPIVKLDIQAGVNGILIADARSNNGALQIAYNDAGAYSFLQSADATTYRSLSLNPNTGNVGIGTTSPGSRLDVKGTLRLSGSSSGYVGFAPQAGAGSTTYTLPASDGTNGQVLTTNGSGQLSWAGSSANSAMLDIQAGVNGILIADARSNNGTLQIAYNDAGAYSFLQSADATTYRSLSLNPNTGNVGIGTTSPGSRLDVKGTLRLSGSSSGYVGFAPQAGAGSTTYTLPASDGTNGQVLATNGAGQLSWADKGSSANSAIRVVSFTLPGTAIVGDNKTCSFIVPFNFTITKAYAYARTGPTGAALIFDIIKNGTSIWNTNHGNRLQITASQNMGIQTNFDTTTFAEYDIIDIDLVQVGSSTAGADITVEIKGTVS